MKDLYLAHATGQNSDSDHVNRLMEAHSKGELAWFFDVDGTLGHYTPGETGVVVQDRELESLLNTLHDQSGGALAIITGRPYEFIQALLPNRNFPVCTEHGAMIAYPGDRDPRPRHHCAYDFAAMRIQVESEIRRRSLPSGIEVERLKRQTLTIQFTFAHNAPALVDPIGRILKETIHKVEQDPRNPLRDVMAPAKGNYVGDILPASACKARTLEDMMQLPAFAGKRTMAAGDSAADAKMLGASDFPVGVGESAPEERIISLDGPENIRNLMNACIHAHRHHRKYAQAREGGRLVFAAAGATS